MKNALIIHGCPQVEEKGMDSEERTYDKHWIPWLFRKLEEQGIETHVPLMPEPWKPRYEAFKQTFEQHSVSADSILIGHSCGAAFLVQWLGETKQEVDTLILVAPMKIPDEDDPQEFAEFYDYAIDGTISERVRRIIVFTADDEEERGRESARMFHDALGGELIELSGRGHYTTGDMETEEFPELLEKIST